MGKRMLTVGSLIPKNMMVYEEVATFNPPHAEQRDYIRPAEQPLQKIELLQNKTTFHVSPVKGNLLDIALTQGQALKYKCRKGTCGACTVKVIEGGSNLSLPYEKEQKKLKNALDSGYRLACQAEIH